MCGIAAIWNGERRPVDAEVLRALTNRMSHRGPDACGFHLDGDLGLGHRRLSIIDIDASHQPMHDDRGLSIVYNGELYNFRQLRDELEKLGYSFRTSGDTEVILAAYSAWGVDCLQRFRGMFAIAIWDSNKREMFLARDRFGIKPLCLYQHREGLAIASEIEAFGGLGDRFRKEVIPEALDQYLYYGYIPAPQSIFRDVYKLPPAHYCLIREPDAALNFVPYWEFRFQPDPALDARQWEEGLIEKLSDAVQSHLVADVPVGAFLSGGIDSSAVVASMCESASGEVNAYTIGFDHPEFDERSITRQSSQMLPINYHEEQLELDVLGTLEILVGRYGEPFADSSAVCTYRVAETAARDVKVMLSGDGGDEIFCGYSHYGWMLDEFLPTFELATRMRLGAGDLLRRVGMRGARATPIEAWKLRNSYFRQEEREALWKEDYRGVPEQTDDFLSGRFRGLRRVNGDSLIDAVQSLDIHDYLPYNNLNKVDIASMCHGLEVRVPLLDHELAEFAARIPWNERIRRHQDDGKSDAAMHGYINKYPLRWYAERTFGRGFFDRKKMGFAMPISSWLASDEYYPQLQEDLISPESPLLNYFRRENLESLLEGHRRDQGGRDQRSGLQLWSLLFLNKWLRTAA